MSSKFTKCAIAVLVLAAVVFGAFQGVKTNKAKQQKNDKAVVTFEDMNKTLVSQYSLTNDENIKNILLIGSDKRGGEKGYGRSDSMMIATIDKKNQSLKLTSLMGDTYVEIPGYGKNRLSMAYSMGGISLLYETIASNFGICLNNYAILSFPEFVKVIDQIDGISVEITEGEAKYMQEHYTNAVKEVQIGNNILNGTQALAYVRMKQDASGDYGRTKRQRTILKAMYSKLSTTSVTDLVPIVGKMLKSTQTDIHSEQMKTYLASVLSFGNTELKEKTFPYDSVYSAKNVEGSVAYEMDPETCKAQLQQFIYQPEESKKE